MGTLPPASLRSTATKRAIPGPTLADGEGSGAGIVADVRSSSFAEGAGAFAARPRVLLGVVDGGLAAGPAAGATGGVADDRVTSPGKSRGGR